VSKHKRIMPKSKKLKYSSAWAVCAKPSTNHPDQKKWYDYGKETALLGKRYENAKVKDPALLQEIMNRFETEATGWLQMNPPDYAGAAKQYLNLESHMFAAGYDSAAIKEAKLRTDHFIDLSGPEWHAQLVEVREYNRELLSMLPCCACCGKSAEYKRLFCGKCNIAVYCGKQCQKLHWNQEHRELCGKQKMCAACKKLLNTRLMCNRCNVAWYCNKAHQTWHWKYGGHKKVCSQLSCTIHISKDVHAVDIEPQQTTEQKDVHAVDIEPQQTTEQIEDALTALSLSEQKKG